ncbi:type II toxin-antitoxin system VapC family toxin [Halotia branconii]|uniref:Type II toxin-antitoxin system VapC family toxin n=1 Tax=Halotia branconii CENA392 TaxID=1539056 RepID=A0AAJ6NQ06_9CYAN|nr:type II toxin-antitoxin system VapC family toxin [Halotia branconii]WGV24288.1 type II toxin-antitoxin system VapC family toxin [Halotia branconii CENA392]
MAYLLDTNVLLRSADPNHPMYNSATNATSLLRNQGETLCIVPQNLIEFWNVYTRPANKNGLGHTASEASEEIRRLKAFFTFLTDTASIYNEWERLAMQYQVKGVNVHDARLVAAMLVHGLTHILTFNISDFARYSEIIAVNPTAIAP